MKVLVSEMWTLSNQSVSVFVEELLNLNKKKKRDP